ncbi:MAG: CooT family nickel-binding protein [Nitrospiraceae bacterium]|nr:CooT family nickel-binding protein [Nitrospiraceae bacterium]
MCDLNAYLLKEGKEELFLENVDVIRPEGDTVYLKSLFGEERWFEGAIKEILAIKRKIVLQPAPKH